MSPAVRALGWFWAGLLVAVAGVAVVLQVRGAPRPSIARAALVRPGPPAPRAQPQPQSSSAPLAAAAPSPPVVAGPGAILPPDPALEEPAPDYVGFALPRIAADGRAPMRVYAAASGGGGRPRIAVLLTGIGLSAAEDDTAAETLPAAVSFAVSPYSYRPDALLRTLRQRGHESFLSLPMEPQDYPTDDPGPEALLTGNIDSVNQQRLEWAMSRIAGYVGVTSAMGTLRGERFAGSATQMAPVLRELGARGLLYIDARPGVPATPGVVERSVDAVVDGSELRSETDRALAELEAVAHDRGSALGVAGPPHPVTVARLASWAATLAARGFALVPVSALVPAASSEVAASPARP